MKDFTKYDFTKFNKDEKHHLYIDADTIIYANAAVCEKDECIVTHIASKREKSFANFPAFIDFLTNDERGKRFTIHDFEVPVIGHAIGNINRAFARILAKEWIQDYRIYVGGVGNFRHDLYDEYKGNRAPKPLLHKYCYDHVLRKFKGKVVVCNGFEAEDHCLADALDDPIGVVGYVDKDLENESALFFNYNHMDMGVFFINKEQAFYNLCIQLMIGDRSTDNIRGIDFVSPELKAKYKMSTKSVGAGTAAKLLADVLHDIPLMKERLIDVYKLSYQGEWKKFLDFTGKLIYITPKRNQIFDVEKFLEGTNE